jgi:hypothetical protein
MKTVTGGNLGDFHGCFLGIAHQAGGQLRASADGLPHGFGIDSVGRSCGLADDSAAAAAKSCYYRQSDKTFPACESDFHALAVIHHVQNRRHGSVGKVAELDWLADFLKKIVKSQVHQDQFGQDGVALFTREIEQNPVVYGTAIAIIS